jgi:hypothetical protein
VPVIHEQHRYQELVGLKHEAFKRPGHYIIPKNRLEQTKAVLGVQRIS